MAYAITARPTLDVFDSIESNDNYERTHDPLPVYNNVDESDSDYAEYLAFVKHKQDDERLAKLITQSQHTGLMPVW